MSYRISIRISIRSPVFYPLWASINALSACFVVIITPVMVAINSSYIGFVLLVSIQPILQSVFLDRYMTREQKLVWITTEAISMASLLILVGILGGMIVFGPELRNPSQATILVLLRGVLELASIGGAIVLFTASIQSLSGMFRRKKLWTLWSTACWLTIFWSVCWLIIFRSTADLN